jgi:hypothetical protein
MERKWKLLLKFRIFCVYVIFHSTSFACIFSCLWMKWIFIIYSPLADAGREMLLFGVGVDYVTRGVTLWIFRASQNLKSHHPFGVGTSPTPTNKYPVTRSHPHTPHFTQHTTTTYYCLLSIKSVHSKGSVIPYLSVQYLPSAGRDSSVSIATRYGLDGLGIHFRWGRDFPHPSISALAPPNSETIVTDSLSPGVKRPWLTLTIHPI